MKRTISFAQLLGMTDSVNLSEAGIELLVYNLDHKDSFANDLEMAKSLKESGQVVLVLGILPFHFEGEKAIKNSLKRATDLMNIADGTILINKEQFCQDKNIQAEDINIKIELLISDIEYGLRDILRTGSIDISAENLKEALRDCGSYRLTHGHGKGPDRIETAFHNALNVSDITHLNMSSARNLIIKVKAPKESPISEDEFVRLKHLISELPQGKNTQLAIGTSDLDDGEVQIVMLGIGVEPEL